MVKTLGMPVAISFDHDLADAHYIGAESKEKTGYDFAKWLVDFHLDNNITPDFDYKVHSMNPVGAKNIQTLLDNFVRNE
jgi:hypothetical protein